MFLGVFFFNFLVRFVLLGSARAVVRSISKIGPFFDHLKFAKYEPGHRWGPLSDKLPPKSGVAIETVAGDETGRVRSTPFLVVVLHPSHMINLLLDRPTGESLVVTSSPFLCSTLVAYYLRSRLENCCFSGSSGCGRIV